MGVILLMGFTAFAILGTIGLLRGFAVNSKQDKVIGFVFAFLAILCFIYLWLILI